MASITATLLTLLADGRAGVGSFRRGRATLRARRDHALADGHGETSFAVELGPCPLDDAGIARYVRAILRLAG